MQKESKTSRRKRKDPQSRDFSCSCGKSYLSYAAAYTHVKNKHNLQKAFVDNIKKPDREQLKRGRPKEKKENINSYQTTLLTLIESSILKICEELQPTFEKTILQGNQQRDETIFNLSFEQLCRQKDLQPQQFSQEGNQTINELINKLNKDFTIQIACRIKLILLIIHKMIHSKQQNTILKKLESLNIWIGHNNVNKLIIQTFNEWRVLHEQEDRRKYDDDLYS